jgi:sensor histidine kinase YesM
MTGIERTLQLKNFLLYNFVFWVLLCVWDIIKTFAFSINFAASFEIYNIIRWPASVYISYWILSFLIFDLYLQSRNFSKWYFLAYNLTGSIFFGIIHKFLTGITGLLLERLFLEAETKTWRELIDLWGKTYFDILGGIFIYWLVLIILIGLDFYRKFNDQNTRRLELEGELGKAQLKSMKMQMNPHFLFNAFNTIAMMVRQKKSEQAVDMIGGLSDMFRMSLNKELRQFVRLREEVELLKKYLAIESLRYQDRLTIEWHINEDALDHEVPNFVLQPIVENAFKHGISKTLEKAVLAITVRQENALLVLEVYNTGGGLSGNWELQRDKGIGLSNTIDRLLRLYKEDFKFLINEKDDGFSVILKLPVKE